ncbi:hypothetical protein [Streptomyces sp. NPDC101166]|uniref:hypothetical protein n=1 Tax=Streptomyces sp. NPDC101166 TaxID=3366120 RepID=UPI0038174257
MPWRAVLEESGPWGRVYDLYRRWQRNSTWQRIVTQLQGRADTKDLITWDVTRPPSCTWPSSRARSPSRSWSRPDSAATSRSSRSS